MPTFTPKRFLASAAAATASTVLVGDTAFAAKARTIAIQTPTTISYWYTGGGNALKIAHQIVDAFNKSHPSTRVDLTTVTAGGGGGISTNQKLLAAITAGKPPDAAYIDRPTMSVPWGVQGALRIGRQVQGARLHPLGLPGLHVWLGLGLGRHGLGCGAQACHVQ